jgi:hypothetical protein
MKLEDQVCSLKSAKRLKELGVAQKSYFWWTTHVDDRVVPRDDDLCTSVHDCGESPCNGQYPEELSKEDDEDIFSAFTMAELFDKLPTFVDTGGHQSFLWIRKSGDAQPRNQLVIGYSNVHVEVQYVPGFDRSKNVAEPLAKMLIYLIENKLMPKYKEPM